jgi:hypothetical protein
MWQQSAANSAGAPKRLGNVEQAHADGPGQGRHHRGLEDPRGDADDPYLEARELVGQRQGQAHHPALGGGIGDLPDLSIEGGDGGRIDNDTTSPSGSGSLYCMTAARHTRKVPIRLTAPTRAKSICAMGPSLPSPAFS